MRNATVARRDLVAASRRPLSIRLNGILPYVVLTTVSAIWLVPIGVALITALRTMGDIIQRGFIALPQQLNVANFGTAWEQGSMAQDLLNSFLITIPSVAGTVFLASMVAFALAQRRIPGSRFVLIALITGSMMPPQMLSIPIYELANQLQIYDTYVPLILVHIGFQIGFCTFVLHNYIRTIPAALTDAALTDGASTWRIYWSVILPLARPALAAMTALEFTWIFNDYFWAIVLIRNNALVPVTVGLVNLQGLYKVDWSVQAAGAVLAIIPTLVVYLALQRYFEKGLTAGVH